MRPVRPVCVECVRELRSLARAFNAADNHLIQIGCGRLLLLPLLLLQLTTNTDDLALT